MEKMGTDKIVEITFAEGCGDIGAFAEAIHNIHGIRSVETDGLKCRAIHGEKERVLNEVIDAAVKQNLIIENIADAEPTLEEIFLKLTGKALRDRENGR